MDRTKLIKEAKQLFHFHKQATTLDDEYTEEMYDFLIAEGLLNLTKEQKITIFADAKIDYMRELNFQSQSSDNNVSIRAGKLMRLMKLNQLPEDETKLLGQMCKVKSIKNYFDSIQNIEFKT